MPLYEYVCSTCGQSFEKTLPFDTEKPDVQCPAGHRKVNRIFSAPFVMFKGSGFYSTDHRSDRPASEEKS